jgi:hypothetical protein
MKRPRKKRATKIEAVIKNYGIMWRRDHIFWGRGSNRGCLEGRRSARIIDFREQIGVYVLYDESRRPIYVGQAGQGNARLFVRLRSHTRDHLAHRWHYVSWFGLLPVNRDGQLSGRDDPGKRVKGTLRSTLNESKAFSSPPPNRPSTSRERGFGESLVTDRSNTVRLML